MQNYSNLNLLNLQILTEQFYPIFKDILKILLNYE